MKDIFILEEVYVLISMQHVKCKLKLRFGN